MRGFYGAISGCSGVVAVVAGKILVVRQVLLGVLFPVVVLQILLAVLFSIVVGQILLAVLFAVGIGCGLIVATSEFTRTGSAEVMAEH